MSGIHNAVGFMSGWFPYLGPLTSTKEIVYTRIQIKNTLP